MGNREKTKSDFAYSAFKIMLKVVSFVSVIAFAFTIILMIYFTSWDDGKADNLHLYYSKISRYCIAADLEWDGDPENMTFTIPDEYEGLKVESLGGGVGMGTPVSFYIKTPHIMHPEVTGTTEDEECIGAIDENTVTYKFTVKLGKNVRNFDHMSYKEYYTDYDGNVMYIVETYYECSPENKWFYSEDGKLYNKRTNELIE